ncbi:DUF5666 domain-containing protein [Hydrogenophaga pseudoflava]|uniref:DUF5666 domain-containing protein n=1 Tax=Hydrogenophaga pseudoflava TaxID=47421 RepID=UPI0027E5A461|nr:DUF5666 domain-containing protein [Hydrogenophaga pseudoflava]MDQ7745605.1 DUF5666 domain-containing protein [Hydrogenophaga pseudoflava]
MTPATTTLIRFPMAALRLMTASMLIAGLAACGGGGGNDSSTASDRSLTGTVTSFESPQRFSVDGIPVDASGSSATPQGMTTGSRVEVHGQMVNGTLQASKVEFDDSDDRDDDNANPNELEGRVTAYTSPTSFSVDGIPVDASGAPSTLAVGMRVEVYGTMANGVLVASRVKIEDGDDDSDDDADDDNCTATGKSDCHDDDGDEHDDGDDHDDDSDDSDDDCAEAGKSDCDKD